ncbi:hypothetical protein G6L37_34550 [Agrobacterium rubi]|nr:hypothetical protein [Agrobacterium rubi]NTF23688.1 hypothetical protein [Agrobacterium rubi]
MTQADDDIPEEVVAAVWDDHLNGSRVSEIARYSHQHFPISHEFRELSAKEVRRVLDRDPPETILSDARYIHGVRAFWMAAYGTVDEQDIKVEAMIYAFLPPRLNSRNFQKAVRAICRDFKHLSTDGYINPQVMEGIEMETALSMLHSCRTIGWIINDDGSVTRYAGEFESEPQAPTP